MITLTFLVLVILYGGLFVWVGFKSRDWSARMLVWLLLLSPVAYIVWSYEAMHDRHQQDCAREGGLKVFIQPEKADRIRLDMDSFISGDYAQFLIRQNFPRLVVIEAWDGKYNGKGQKTGYFAYSLDPSTQLLPKKDWTFLKTPIHEPTANFYSLRKESFGNRDHNKFRWELIRGSQTYAAWTSFNHYWSKNGVMSIGWQCFGSRSPEAKGLEPDQELIALIL